MIRFTRFGVDKMIFNGAVIDMNYEKYSMKMREKKRIPYLDYARGIAIIIVVLLHLTWLPKTLGYVEVIGRMQAMLNDLFNSFVMPLFFIISGYLIALKNSYRQFSFSKGTKRLLIPYFLISLLYILIEICSNKPWLGRFYATICGRGQAPAWFLASLFFAECALNYLLYTWSNLFSENQRKKVFIRVVGVAITTAITTFLADKLIKSLSIQSDFIMYPLVSVFRFFPSLFFLSIGWIYGNVFCGVFLEEKKIKKIIVFIVSMFVMGVVQVISKNEVNMHLFKFANVIAFLITGCTGSLAILAFCSLLPTNIHALSEVGKLSLHIMWIHYPPMSTLEIVIYCFYRLGWIKDYWGMSLVGIIVSTLLALAFKKAVNCFLFYYNSLRGTRKTS